ncbi:aminotransferase class I/II-fold pyridoxal phosphate-dependent enzyme [Loigolactobacillus zhaoyuanensis]|uniref:Aminotransferase class I/II-fold pyridoxal phosphate-dependent enzyme n=1 Tax=Loigolactobacillus zhaoyuanensis TaxID=2486017 RepID=A0ABW8UEF2_9LACO|nr:aminotransferase class I/II-fold pyridoxal phosphate-dependent enzyme [Loigolactobacillus zhaoyuanensis]
MSKEPWQQQIETILAQAGNRSDDQQTGAIAAPLYFSTAFRHQGLGQSTGYDYSRVQTPTRALLESVLATMEHAEHGYALSSGMAAIQLVFSQFKSGEHIITSDDLYGGSFRYFDQLTANYHLEFSQWAGQDYKQLDQLIQPNTKAIWLETPSNPTMKSIDIAQTAAIAHKHGLQLIVDNTFYTPILQQPLLLGADVVVHSATKYMAGHNDILAGAIMVNDAAIAEQLTFNLVTTGAVLDPFSCWLLLRSLKTLPLRLQQQQANAQVLVAALEKSAAVTKVLYPGKGAMISFYLADTYSVAEFLQQLKVISFAESLGGVESLLTVPDEQTHHDMPVAQRRALGITPNLLRLSVGIENSVDLQHDLAQAFAASKI